MRSEHETLMVIGGTSGIGLATAHGAANAGADVIIVGRDKEKLGLAVAAVGAKSRGELVDAADRGALDALFARTARFDHLVLAASGGAGSGPLGALPGDDLKRGFDAKFWIHWDCLQAGLPFLSAQGSITLVTAASARMGNPNTSGLAAINGALGAMVLSLAHELGPIRVNAVSPGVIDTPWWLGRPEAMKRQVFGQIASTVPVRTVGRAEDMADAIIFLAGNRHVTGIILDVDGGMR
jgi:NAD(P)-dependent dehydrogenase (short-subunit alcohol dehydrogenase family)